MNEVLSTAEAVGCRWHVLHDQNEQGCPEQGTAHAKVQPFARGLGKGLEGKENFSSVYDDKKCLALTFYLPTASSNKIAVVN